MKVQDFDFTLPPELIAQTPLDKRDESRLMVVAKAAQTITDDHFYNLPRYLKPGDVLVRNNTKVLPARLFGVKEDTGGHVEILLLKDLGDDIWECLVGNAKIVKENTVITIGPLKARCVKVLDEGIRHFQMIYEGIFYELLDELGTMPLPPYIKETLKDNDRYNTVYATVAGSAAAPTAGLHFTPELFNEIKSMGVTVLDVTLHVGLGTFRPVKQENIQDHHMHSEYYEMNEETAQALNQAKAEKRRIIAVGTTSTRVLETIYGKYSRFQAGKGNTDIFIYPGYEFKAIDALITNFHLPKSTLVMLVCALAGKDLIFKAYDHAIAERYRFFSFGDSMLILP